MSKFHSFLMSGMSIELCSWNFDHAQKPLIKDL